MIAMMQMVLWFREGCEALLPASLCAEGSRAEWSVWHDFAAGAATGAVYYIGVFCLMVGVWLLGESASWAVRSWRTAHITGISE